MIDSSQLMTTGALGIGGTITTALISLATNILNDNHAFRMKSLDDKYRSFERQVKDTQAARKIPFKFARRSMIFSVFFFIWLLLFVVSTLNIPISIPVEQTRSFGFGLIQFSGTVIKTIEGFPFMSKAFCDIMTLMGGFYFGCSFKND